MNSLVNLIHLPPISDDRGSLVAVEANKTVPFNIKRAYYIFGGKRDIARGFHAHKALQQLAICLMGSCRISLDDGRNKEEVLLASPTNGLMIQHLVWHEMYDFSDDCVLLVLADNYYDEDDYIREYNEFIRVVGV